MLHRGNWQPMKYNKSMSRIIRIVQRILQNVDETPAAFRCCFYYLLSLIASVCTYAAGLRRSLKILNTNKF